MTQEQVKEAMEQSRGPTRREIWASTFVSLSLIGCSTLLGYSEVLSPEAVVGAWGLATGALGVPVVIKRGNGTGR